MQPVVTHQTSWLGSTGAVRHELQVHGVEQKFLMFLAGFDGKNWNHFYGRKHGKVKQRVRKGIPDAVRGLAWQMLAGSRELVQLNPGGLFMHSLCSFVHLVSSCIYFVCSFVHIIPSCIYFDCSFVHIIPSCIYFVCSFVCIIPSCIGTSCSIRWH